MGMPGATSPAASSANESLLGREVLLFSKSLRKEKPGDHVSEVRFACPRDGGQAGLPGVPDTRQHTSYPIPQLTHSYNTRSNPPRTVHEQVRFHTPVTITRIALAHPVGPGGQQHGPAPLLRAFARDLAHPSGCRFAPLCPSNLSVGAGQSSSFNTEVRSYAPPGGLGMGAGHEGAPAPPR